MIVGLALAHAALTPMQAQASATEPTHLGAYVRTIEGLARPVAVAFPPADGDSEVHGLHVAVQGALRGEFASPPGVVVVDAAPPSPEDGGADVPVAATIGVGVLERPTGVAVDGSGGVWVTDDLQHALWYFPAGGGAARRIAERGSAGGELVLPADVDVARDPATGNDLVLVADAGNARAQLLDVGATAWASIGVGVVDEPTSASFAPAPDGTLLVAIADGARHRVEVFALDGTHVGGFGDWGGFPSLLSTPTGLASADGNVFVADSENHRIQAFRVDPEDRRVGRLAYRFGVHAIRPGDGAGSLHYPSDVAVAADASVLALTEPLDDRVQLFVRAPGAEPEEDPLRASIGPPAAHFGPPVAASGIYLATVSPESHRVQIHDLRLDEPVRISEAYVYGDRLGMMRGPSAVWLGADGRELLTLDRGNRRLSRAVLDVRPDEPLAQDPELAQHTDAVDLRALTGEPAFVPGAVARIRREEGDLVAVTDRGSERIAFLDDDLQLVRFVACSGHGGDPLPGIGVRGIDGIAATDRGTLLVVDGAGGRVLEVDAEGRALASFGDELSTPSGIAAAGARVWVTDRLRDRVEIYDRADDGTYAHVRGFGGRGLGRAEFHGPRGVAILADGRVVVLDHGNHRGQIFDREGNFVGGFGSRLYTAELR